MRTSNVGLCLGALLATCTQALTVEKSKPFPGGYETENMAIRPSGNVLTTIYTAPYIYEVAPVNNSEPKRIYTFEHLVHGVVSLAPSSYEPDVYFVATGNFSFQTFTPTPNSYAIHRLSFDKDGKPVTKQLAYLDAVKQVNGIITVPDSPYVLITDTYAGFIYRFNTENNELSLYFDNPLLKPKPVAPYNITFGVNGIKLSRGYLYFSNTNQQLLARIKATGRESCLEGTPEIVAKQTPVDDFIVDSKNGDVYLAEQDPINGLGFVSGGAYGGVPKTLYGGANTTELLGPTAVQWAKGQEGKKLIISATGNFSDFAFGTVTVPGRLNFVTL